MTVETNPDKPKKKKEKSIIITEKNEKTYVLQLGERRKIMAVISEEKDGKYISLQDYRGTEEFVFLNKLTKETLDKWEEVMSLISKAIEIAREEI